MQSTRSVGEEALDAIRAWWHAWATNDVSKIESMKDAEYLDVSRASALHPSAARLGCRCSERAEIASFRIAKPATKAFRDTVVCMYSFDMEVRRGRRRFAYRGHAIDVLRRRGDRWTYVSHRSTFVS